MTVLTARECTFLNANQNEPVFLRCCLFDQRMELYNDDNTQCNRVSCDRLAEWITILLKWPITDKLK
jgi:hypothetical protein